MSKETEEPCLATITAEYFEMVKPCIHRLYPYTSWAIYETHQCAKRVIGELAARHGLTEEALLQAVRAVAQQQGGQAA